MGTRAAYVASRFELETHSLQLLVLLAPSHRNNNNAMFIVKLLLHAPAHKSSKLVGFYICRQHECNEHNYIYW